MSNTEQHKLSIVVAIHGEEYDPPHDDWSVMSHADYFLYIGKRGQAARLRKALRFDTVEDADKEIDKWRTKHSDRTFEKHAFRFYN